MPTQYQWFKDHELVTLGNAHDFISQYYVSQATSVADSVKRRKRETGDWPSWLALEVNTRYPGSIKEAINELEAGQNPVILVRMTDQELLEFSWFPKY